METISINYALVWRFCDYPHLQITRCKKVFNVKTGKRLKQVMNGGSIGYWVATKVFIPASKINNLIEKIPTKEYCPF